METRTCPRCRTRMHAADAALRCPACGVRTQVGIVAKALARPASTAIAEGFPASAQRPHAKPQSVLDRLIARLRRWRRIHDYPGGGGDDADCYRIGWWLLTLSLLPFIVGAIVVLLLPAIAYATLRDLEPETVGVRDLLVFTALVIVPSLVCAGLVWLYVRRVYRDDEA